jgi:hypothetical protein
MKIERLYLSGHILLVAASRTGRRRSPAHRNMDVFVFAMSSVSRVSLSLLLMAKVLLMNQSKIERQMRIAVRSIRTPVLISAAMQLCRKPWVST